MISYNSSNLNPMNTNPSELQIKSAPVSQIKLGLLSTQVSPPPPPPTPVESQLTMSFSQATSYIPRPESSHSFVYNGYMNGSGPTSPTSSTSSPSSTSPTSPPLIILISEKQFQMQQKQKLANMSNNGSSSSLSTVSTPPVSPTSQPQYVGISSNMSSPTVLVPHPSRDTHMHSISETTMVNSLSSSPSLSSLANRVSIPSGDNFQHLSSLPASLCVSSAIQPVSGFYQIFNNYLNGLNNHIILGLLYL